METTVREVALNIKLLLFVCNLHTSVPQLNAIYSIITFQRNICNEIQSQSHQHLWFIYVGIKDLFYSTEHQRGHQERDS